MDDPGAASRSPSIKIVVPLDVRCRRGYWTAFAFGWVCLHGLVVLGVLWTYRFPVLAGVSPFFGMLGDLALRSGWAGCLFFNGPAALLTTAYMGATGTVGFVGPLSIILLWVGLFGNWMAVLYWVGRRFRSPRPPPDRRRFFAALSRVAAVSAVCSVLAIMGLVYMRNG